MWRCRALQSEHGWQRKGELTLQGLTKHSGNRPGSQPQWVSATVEQFVTATWETGRSVQEMGEMEAIRARAPSPGAWGQIPWKMEMGTGTDQRQRHPQRERSMEMATGPRLRHTQREEGHQGERGKGISGQDQGGGPARGGHRPVTPRG